MMEDHDSDRPLLSIAIPTYNREDTLMEIIGSLLGQEFQDIEILVGNDFIEKELTLAGLGISDARVKIFNHKINLGELDNMNYLLDAAKGQYFTWQFDDDPCAVHYLEQVSIAITDNNLPDCIFSPFETIYGEQEAKGKFDPQQPQQCFPGREFLTRYLKNEIQALGCCGFYRLDYLKSLGGVTRLSKGKMALFSEFLLLVKQGLADKVVYLNNPLVVTRHHKDSWTFKNDDYQLFREAGLSYIRESLVILSDPHLQDDFEENLAVILSSVIGAVSVKAWQSKKMMAFAEMKNYFALIEIECRKISNPELRNCSGLVLTKASQHYSLHFIKAVLKQAIPFWVFSFIQRNITSVRKLSRRNF
ncbi:MAG: glycosyltransferase [Gammaproteobacteria bacterium]|nr:glycosyltransferase [Gammaproteobacteria bacterium]